MKALPFDRDLTLLELLRGVSAPRLEAALSKLLGPLWQLTDLDGKAVRSSPLGARGAALSVPLHCDIDTVGQLWAADVPGEQVQAAGAWLDLVLAGAYRYQMAADLHVEAVNSDFEALQKKHAALQASETRYRELATQLEQRVKQQVEVIERAQRQLYQSEKLASVGSLAAGMAHEINNPMGFIRSNLVSSQDYVHKLQQTLSAYRSGETERASQLWSSLDIDFVLEDFPALLAESVAGADRVAHIVTNLKKYASIDDAMTMPIDPNNALRAVAEIALQQRPVALTFDLQPLPVIVCDQSRINQMLLSLLQNAVQAIEGQADGQIHISTRLLGTQIQIAIADNGGGIAASALSRIFDPFFTTRGVGKGLGLGLTLASDIAVAHGGRIEVNSTQGAGSTFTVYLPVHQTANASNPSTAAT
jgi:two-component system NtrC family sensor kinase